MGVPALEPLISKLDNSELYARAQNQVSSINKFFILDITDRLPFYIKNCCADFLLDHCGNLDNSSFETFKTFLNPELHRSNNTFTQRLLGSHKKDENAKPREKIRIRQANVEIKRILPTPVVHGGTVVEWRIIGAMLNTCHRQAPICFICSSQDREYRHLLNDCNKCKGMAPQERPASIIQEGHCINCLHTIMQMHAP